MYNRLILRNLSWVTEKCLPNSLEKIFNSFCAYFKSNFLFVSAEKFLQTIEGNSNYSLLLLHIVENGSFDSMIRLAAAITFKNFVKRQWRVVSIRGVGSFDCSMGKLCCHRFNSGLQGASLLFWKTILFVKLLKTALFKTKNSTVIREIKILCIKHVS